MKQHRFDDTRHCVDCGLPAEIVFGCGASGHDCFTGLWLTMNCRRALYVDRGRDVILCDRLPAPVTLLVQLQ